MEEYIVYIKLNKLNKITEINSSAFVKDAALYLEIDRGCKDKYHHAQNNYLPKPLVNIDGTHNYVYSNSLVREATADEMTTELASLPKSLPSVSERLTAAESALLALMGGV